MSPFSSLIVFLCDGTLRERSPSFEEDLIETSASLLERLRTQPDQASWQRLMDLYQPLLQSWLRRYRLQASDVDDLVQEVLTTIVSELPHFHYDPNRGSFRGWLRGILINRLRRYWRNQQSLPKATGDSDFLKGVLDQLEDRNSDLSKEWDLEHDRHIAYKVLNQIKTQFEPTTWEVFYRVVLQETPPATVATTFGISVNAVFIAKSRILRALRKEIRGLSDDLSETKG